MSTRGCVAIGVPARWRGVYNHWDSYPTRLGREVWQHLQTILQEGKSLDMFASELLCYDDWRAYLRKGICEYCGKQTTQPHSISGVIISPRLGESFKTKAELRQYYCSLPAWCGREAEIEAAVRREWQIRENIKRTGYPDPNMEYHQHDTRAVDAQQITSENPDPLFIEWVYVIDPKTATLHILSYTGESRAEGEPLKGESCKPAGDGRWDYGHCVFWHKLVGTFSLRGAEPDWKLLEAKADNPRESTPEK